MTTASFQSSCDIMDLCYNTEKIMWGKMKILRIYVDTSVFGGCFDEEFETDSVQLFDLINSGKFILVVSEVTFAEISKAPKYVQNILTDIDAGKIEIIEMTDEIDNLRDAYLNAGILGKASFNDAYHVACASVANVDIIVSWNFKHIVHFEKIRGFNAVNLLNGYNQIAIYSPKEVINYD